MKESRFLFSVGYAHKEKSAEELSSSFIRKTHHKLQFPPFP